MSPHDGLAADGYVTEDVQASGSDSAPHEDDVPWWKRPSPLLILPFMFLLPFNLAMAGPVRPELMVNLVCYAKYAHGNASVGGLAGMAIVGNEEQPRLSKLSLYTSTAGMTSWLQGGIQPLSTTFATVDNPTTASTVTTVSREAPPPYEGIDPKLCKRDIDVQQRLAKLDMAIGLMCGILVVLTTGYWSSLSDKIGRCNVLAIGLFGAFLTESVFLLVNMWPQLVLYPGLYIVAAGGICHSMLGGFATFGAAAQAYISDVAPGQSLSSLFSTINGLAMAGAATGSLFGAFLVRSTSDSLMPVKVAVLSHSVAALLLLFGLPESLSHDARRDLASKALERQASFGAQDAATEDRETAEGNTRGNLWARSISRRARKAADWAIQPFESFSILAPKPRDPDHPELGKNWNMLLLAGVTFVTCITTGIIQPKLQYAMFTFGWGSQEIGLLSFLGSVCRFMSLMIIIPVLARYVKPRFIRARQRSVAAADERTPLLAADDPEVTEAVQSSNVRSPIGDMLYDKAVITVCLLIEIVGYLIIGVGTKANPALFVITTGLHHLAAPANPVVGSLTMELKPQEVSAGRLFGAFGVVDALSSALLSPFVFNMIFAATLGSYPAAIFLVASLSFVIALLLILGVRIPRS